MACKFNCFSPLSQSIRRSSKSFFESLAPPIQFQRAIPSFSCFIHPQSPAKSSFTWDDVFQISGSANDASSDLSSFYDKISACNRNSDKQIEFMPFVVEDQIVGFVHNGFADILRNYQDVFVFPQIGTSSVPSSGYVTLQAALRTSEEKTDAVGNVIRSLGEDVIPGNRNEAYGVHMNGYIERNGEEFLWLGKRSDEKPTFPGMLDHLVAGGLPYGISCSENMIKECEEEAGIPRSIANAKAVGAVSYSDIDGYRYKRDVLFCYDLKLPEDFVPNNQDGEVESFKLIPVSQVMNVIKQTNFFKPNCCLVIIDFLVRHGYITPDDPGPNLR
ncbi:hypothetical protein V2J09_010297 [Rumex salicifolius]